MNSLLKTAVAHFLLQGACMTAFYTTALLSATRREAAYYFHTIFQRPQQNKWVKIWGESLRPSVRATLNSVGTGVEATPKWMRLNLELLQLIPDILGSSEKSGDAGCSVGPRSALWVTESTGEKYWGNLSLRPQTWKDNVPTVLPDVVSLPDLGGGG